MKKLILLFLLFPLIASAQVTPPFAFWKSTAAGGFTPASIDSLKIWYAADDLGVTKSDGDTTFFWQDKKSGFHLNRATDSQKPVFRDSSGVKWVRFDGVDDDMAALSDFYPQPGTIVAVIKPKSRSLSYNMYFDGANSSARHSVFARNVNTNWQILSNTAVITNHAVPLDSLAIVYAVFDSPSSSIESNGTGTYGITTGTQEFQGFLVGANPFSDSYNGNVCVYELMYIHRKLTAGEKADMDSYLQNKYGVTW